MDEVQEATVIVCGHSYVKRIGKILDEKRDEEKSHLPMEAFAPQYLKLSQLVNNIFFDGESGAGVMDDFSLLPFLLRNNKPSVVIMDIGSNDIVILFNLSVLH